MAIKRKAPLLLVLILLSGMNRLFAQNNEAGIQGRVYNPEGKPLIGITVQVKGTARGDATDDKGHFEIGGLKAGRHILKISAIGYVTQEHEVSVGPDQSKKIEITLTEDTLQMETVVVEGKSTSEELRETGYTVDVIETQQHKSFATDINQVLESAAGVQLREQGGLGSSFKLSLNGLSGNQIRYFIDGIPMENFGSALTLNNFPVNLIQNIEVYKGVVPISLGADALGGAININTAYRQQSFLDASYSYGSFHTHRSSLNGQYADREKGYFVRMLSFFNHSDNNYEMESVPVYDLELGNKKGTISTRRFHNEYTSGMGRVETGLINKEYADYLSIGLTYARNRKNYQHPDNNINTVFGHFHTRNNTSLASLQYEKEFSDLTVSAYLLGGKIRDSVIDTSKRKYNWAGDFITRSPDDPKGELFRRRSLLELDDKILKSNAGADYAISDNHSLSLNFTQNYLERTGEDKVNSLNRSFESPNFIHKNFLGLAYTFKTDRENLEATVFGKRYWYNGKIVTQDYEDNDVITKPGFSNTGYGALFTWRFMEGVQVKTSFEKTFRVPESFEILGDGIYIQPNPQLEPEKSHNANLGLRYADNFGNLDVKAEANYFFRSSRDFIRFNPLGPFGKYENLENVRSTGIEGALELNYNDFLMLSSNFTYQNLRDQTKFDEGLRNVNYQSRIPNIPYLFGNARFGINPGITSEDNNLTFYWNTEYVHEFFLTWENLGDAETKNVIPRQLVHDVQAEYAMDDGRYSISLSVRNVTDAVVYDNFNIQKPGRAVYIKLGYFFN